MRTTASFVVVKDATFRDGTIAVGLAEQPAAGQRAPPDFDLRRSRGAEP